MPSSSAAIASGRHSPAPTLTSAPTIRRAIFQRKWDAASRTRISPPSSTTSAWSRTTIVLVWSAGRSQKPAKSRFPWQSAAAAAIAAGSSGRLTHQTNRRANGVLRREIW